MGVRDHLHGQKDLVVGVFGALALTILVIALFFVRGVSFGPGVGPQGGGSFATYDVDFETESHDVSDLPDNAEGRLQAGQSVEVTIPVDAANVTAFTATLTWSSDGAGQGDLNMDTLSLKVEGPSDSVECEGTAQSSQGTLELTCTGVEVPAAVEDIGASSTQAALDQAAQRVPARLGATGPYVVTVALEDTNDAALDDSNGYAVAATYTDYHAQATVRSDAP